MALVVLVVAFFAALAPHGRPPTTEVSFDGAKVTYQTPAALLAQCGPTYTYEPTSPLQTRAVDGITQDLTMGVRTIVPILGPMATRPAPTKPSFYRYGDKGIPDKRALLRSMWDGTIVVYYDRSATDVDVEVLEQLSQRDDLKLIVVPWTAPQSLPMGRSLAFATFGTSQSCHRLAPKALEDFRAFNPIAAAPGPKTGRAPRTYVLTAKNRDVLERCSPGLVCRITVTP